MEDLESEENYYIDPECYDNQTYEDNSNSIGLTRSSSYCVIKENEAILLRDNMIAQAEGRIELSRDDLLRALIYFKWDPNSLAERWYDNLEANLANSGISQSWESKLELKNQGITGNNKDCMICFNPKKNCKEYLALSCNHYFCGECWNYYLDDALKEVNTAMYTLCPQKGCNILVPESYFLKYIADNPKDSESFTKATIKNFIEANKVIKYCPTPNCAAFVHCESKSNKEINCICGTNFCFKCLREGHRPCTCDMVEIWDKKNKSESENVKWMMVNAKQCPSCHKFIEKNQGCDHMTCQKKAGGCGHEFCWICFKDWKGHTTCNKFEDETKQIKVKDIKIELEKYIHYFDRYMNHAKALKLGLKLRNSIEYGIQLFNTFKNVPFPDLIFLREAVETVAASRRLLKYSYVFGFYLKKCNSKALFEHNQSLLEGNANRLHELLENETMNNIMALDDFTDFNDEFKLFKNMIIDLYTATNKYNFNLMNSIENTMLGDIDYKLLK